jgi:two-component system sensor histidine kinase BaeS
VLDGDGNPVDSAELPEPLTAEDIPFDRVIEGETVDGVRGTVAFAAAATRLEAKPNWAIVVVATRGFEPLFGPTFRWFLLSALVALVAAVAASWSLANKLSRPIHAATDVAQRIADGDLSARIRSTGADPNPASPDELERLAAAIDSMADSLERSRGLEQQFLMSVSHDLRTPLTNIGGWAEAITDGAAAEPARAAAIIGRESQRLVDDLLDLAKLNSNEFRYQLGVHDLRSLAETTVHGFEAEAAAAGIRISLADPETATETAPGTATETATETATGTAPAGVVAEAISAATPVRVDADRAQQVLGNLMANALKYAHSAITVQVDVAAPNVSLSVIDDGPGIAPEDLPHVFERLYQANARPTRSESGSGLGLAIVDQLVRGMHGTVEVASDGASGTRFTVTFPLADG